MNSICTAFVSHGFIRFECASETESTIQIAERIGEVLTIPGVPQIQSLVPRAIGDCEESNYSGNFGMQEFPLHTDMANWSVPPRYFLLRCVQPARSVKTLFLHARQVFEGEDPLSLRRALFRPRRRIDGRLSILRLYDGDCYRWDSIFIQPVNALASELRARILERIATSSVQAVTFENSRECILVDNWRVFHGRSAVPSLESHRVVERVYLNSVNL